LVVVERYEKYVMKYNEVNKWRKPFGDVKV